MAKPEIIRRASFCFIKTESAARKLADHLVRSPNDSIILPHVDHPDALIQQVFSKDFASLIACEPNEKARNRFKSFYSTHPAFKKIDIFPNNLIDLTLRYNFENSNQCSKALVDRARELARGSLDETKASNAIKVLYPMIKKSTQSKSFHLYLYNQLCLGRGIFAGGPLSVYYFMSAAQLKVVTCKPGENLQSYRAGTVTFNNLFKLNHLETFSYFSDFDLGPRKPKKSTDEVYFVSIEPRVDVLEKHGPDLLLEFRYFVEQFMGKRSRKLSTGLENWFLMDLCDYQMLNLNPNMRVGDMDPELVFKLFLYVRSREDYYRSSLYNAFQQISDRYISKLE